MDGHILPSLYPAIIVGMLLGFSYRSMSSTIVGGLGGLIGGAVGYFGLKYFDLAIPLGTIVFGAIVAVALVHLLGLVHRSQSGPTDTGLNNSK